MNADSRPPLPPFDETNAHRKVRLAEDAWNSRDPERVALAYTQDSHWRNRDRFIVGRDQIREFLRGKWQREQHYRLIKELWAFTGNRISARFAYEWQDADGQWWRSYGNENWAFDECGLMAQRLASINDRIWYGEARFTHAKHSTMTCNDCHKAAESKSATDLLIPDLANCRQCHAGESGGSKVASTCIACHRYHQSTTLQLKQL